MFVCKLWTEQVRLALLRGNASNYPLIVTPYYVRVLLTITYIQPTACKTKFFPFCSFVLHHLHQDTRKNSDKLLEVTTSHSLSDHITIL